MCIRDRDNDGNPVATYNLPSFIPEALEEALENGVNNLRDGKGAIYIKSSGNDYLTSATADCTTGDLSCTDMVIDNYQGMPYIIQVGALQATGFVSSYTTPGSALWISGFGGEYGYSSSYASGYRSGTDRPAMLTTDQSGCTNGFVGSNGGTQSVSYTHLRAHET